MPALGADPIWSDPEGDKPYLKQDWLGLYCPPQCPDEVA
jgi:hypothetical protein